MKIDVCMEIVQKIQEIKGNWSPSENKEDYDKGYLIPCEFEKGLYYYVDITNSEISVDVSGFVDASEYPSELAEAATVYSNRYGLYFMLSYSKAEKRIDISYNIPMSIDNPEVILVTVIDEFNKSGKKIRQGVINHLNGTSTTLKDLGVI